VRGPETILGLEELLGSPSKKQEVMMQTGLRATGWGLQRLSIVVGVVVLAAVLAFVTLVFAIVVVQGIAAFSR
jgi:Mg2+/Co2+ transporter CorB